MRKTILHCDCNGFFASVECILNPKLKDVPMAVCGNPESRHGIILAKNELAKKYKIITAETVWQAKKKCPELILVEPHHDEYHKYSKVVNKIYEEFTDLVESFGIDESWLDVTNSDKLFGDGVQIANLLREKIKKEVGLTISVGVSFNKIFAKLGSDYKKPDATTVIDEGNYKKIIYPLPVSDLLYVGKSMTKELEKIGIHTIGQLANSDKGMIQLKFGKMGEVIHNYANGLDDSPVKSIYEKSEVKSVGNGMTFRRNLVGLEDIDIGVTLLADTVAARMRSYEVKCSTVQVTIKSPDFKTINRQKPLNIATNLSLEIREAAMYLIKSSWNIKSPIRMLTITGTNLVNSDIVNEQIGIFQNENRKHEKEEKLEKTIDNIRNKYGLKSIKIANTMKTDIVLNENNNED